MPYIDPDVVQQAKRLDLLTYLQNYEPDELVHFSGSTFTTRSHDSLKISNGMWTWWSQGIGGKSALDYLIKVRGLSSMDAVVQITGRTAVMPPLRAHVGADARPKHFVLPQRWHNNDAVIQYLRRRGIHEDVIRACIEDGSIYESHRRNAQTGRVYINAVFMGFDYHAEPKYAALRGVDSSYKGEATGSDKRFSFFLPATGDGQSDTLCLFESAIDLLSAASLAKYLQTDGQHGYLLSLAGVYTHKNGCENAKVPLPLECFLDAYPYIDTIEFHLDNDPTGRLATKEICAALHGYTLRNCAPMFGKDCNDNLLHYLSLKQRMPERKEAR